VLDQLRLRVDGLIRPKHSAVLSGDTGPSDPSAEIEAIFVRRLREIVASSNSALAGRVNLLGLGRIKRHFGADWQRVAERAERIARNAIERRLGPSDIYGKWDEFEFVLVMANLTAAAAQLKCALMAREIAADLIGEEGAELIEVKSAVVRLDGEVDFETVPVRAALLRLLHEPGAGPPSGPVVRRPAAGRSRPRPARLRPLGRGGTGGNGPAADPTLDNPGEATCLAGLRFMYRPMWDPVRANAVLFASVPLLPALGEVGGWRPAYSAVANDADLKARIDRAARQAAILEIRKLVAAGRRLLLCIPVHFDTLAKLSGRLEYIHALASLSEAEKRLLLFELVDVPNGVLQGRLLELTTALRSNAYGVVARLDLARRDFAPLKESGMMAVGAECPARAQPERLVPEALRFAQSARKAGLRAYLDGLPCGDALPALRGAFAYLGGDAVAPAVDTPERMARLDFPEP